jgi:hypothetical protein
VSGVTSATCAFVVLVLTLCCVSLSFSTRFRFDYDLGLDDALLAIDTPPPQSAALQKLDRNRE